MRATIWTGLCAAVLSVGTAGLMAQTTTTSTPSSQQSSGSNADNKITVTGCLKAAPAMPDAAASPTGTSGTVQRDRHDGNHRHDRYGRGHGRAARAG